MEIDMELLRNKQMTFFGWIDNEANMANMTD